MTDQEIKEFLAFAKKFGRWAQNSAVKMLLEEEKMENDYQVGDKVVLECGLIGEICWMDADRIQLYGSLTGHSQEDILRHHFEHGDEVEVSRVPNIWFPRRYVGFSGGIHICEQANDCRSTTNWPYARPIRKKKAGLEGDDAIIFQKFNDLRDLVFEKMNKNK